MREGTKVDVRGPGAPGRLEVGQAVIKLQGRYTRPFLVCFPEVPATPLSGEWAGEDLLGRSAGQNQEVGTQIKRLDKDEKLLLADVLACEESIMKERLKRMDMTAHRFIRARKKLEARGLVEISRVTTKTGLVVFVQPTEKARDFVAE